MAGAREPVVALEDDDTEAASSLDRFAVAKLADLEARHLRRQLIDTVRTGGIWVERKGRRLMSFSCNDYLNLTSHPTVIEAAIAALRQHGAGSGASRLVTGNHPLFSELEVRLARLKGTQAACVFSSGYQANTGIIPALIGSRDFVLIDELAHACLWAGARMTGGRVLAFRHNDVAHAEEILAAHRGQYRHGLIATDGVFSMDGDLAPLPELAALARDFDVWLMSDDAHGIGVIGGGRGSTYAHRGKVDVPLQMGTLSKAVGSHGGYLCASAPVIDLIKTRARTLVYSTGLPPAMAAAALAALDIIERERAYSSLPLAKAKAFACEMGLEEAQSPIVPVIIGGVEETLEASRLLEDEGFLVAAIRPPTVPDGTARLRFAFTARHPDSEVKRLAAIVRNRVLKR
jgi:8-amino-7-oxononanoate synthase